LSAFRRSRPPSSTRIFAVWRALPSPCGSVSAWKAHTNRRTTRRERPSRARHHPPECRRQEAKPRPQRGRCVSAGARDRMKAGRSRWMSPTHSPDGLAFRRRRRHRQIGKRKTNDLLILETSHTDRGSIDSVNKFGKRIDCAASGRKYHHCSPPPGHLSTQVTNHALAAHAPKRSALERAGGIVKQFLDFQFSRNESLLQRVLDDGLQRPPAGI